MTDDKPDLSKLYVAVATRNQGISYHPGTWHHPMVALETVTDFACLVHETGGEGDTEVEPLDASVLVEGVEACLQVNSRSVQNGFFKLQRYRSSEGSTEGRDGHDTVIGALRV
jgi:hypothetical protein